MSFFFLISGWIAINISHFFNRILNVKKLIKYILFNHFLKHGVMCHSFGTLWRPQPEIIDSKASVVTDSRILQKFHKNAIQRGKQ
jgi:hypothetical protein